MFSTFNALTFTPVAASRLLHAERREPAWLARWITPPQRWLESLEGPYGRWLDRVMRHPRLVVLLLLAGLLATGVALQQRPTAFIPRRMAASCGPPWCCPMAPPCPRPAR